MRLSLLLVLVLTLLLLPLLCSTVWFEYALVSALAADPTPAPAAAPPAAVIVAGVQ
jgi:hypothetical protein